MSLHKPKFKGFDYGMGNSRSRQSALHNLLEDSVLGFHVHKGGECLFSSLPQGSTRQLNKLMNATQC